MNRVFLLLAFFAVLQSCGTDPKDKQNNEKENNSPKVPGWVPPAAGTVVDKFEQEVAEDRLNNAYFRVVVTATAESNKGNYALTLQYRANKNETTIELPKWYDGVILKPVLKGGPDKYECQLGFDAGDGVFKELYQIKVDNGDIKLKQIKGYYADK